MKEDDKESDPLTVLLVLLIRNTADGLAFDSKPSSVHSWDDAVDVIEEGLICDKYIYMHAH